MMIIRDVECPSCGNDAEVEVELCFDHDMSTGYGEPYCEEVGTVHCKTCDCDFEVNPTIEIILEAE